MMFSLVDFVEMQWPAHQIPEFKPEEHVLPDFPVDPRILAVYKYLRKKEMDTNNQAGLVGGLKTSGLTFNEAMKAMHSGYKVRLPEWTGYWFINNGEMSVFTREGDILNTPDFKKFGDRDDWEIAIRGMGFDFAVLALKDGKLLQRAAWPRSEFVFFRPASSLTTGFILDNDRSLPGNFKSWVKQTDSRETGSEQGLTPVKFSGYFCMKDLDNNVINGWTPSQDDMFATDWIVVQVPEWQPSTDHPGLGSGTGTQNLNLNLEQA